jgi:hypothetical protein
MNIQAVAMLERMKALPPRLRLLHLRRDAGSAVARSIGIGCGERVSRHMKRPRNLSSSKAGSAASTLLSERPAERAAIPSVLSLRPLSQDERLEDIRQSPNSH